MENVCVNKVNALLINKWNYVYNNTITCIYTNIFINNYIQYYIKSTQYVIKAIDRHSCALAHVNIFIISIIYYFMGIWQIKCIRSNHVM